MSWLRTLKLCGRLRGTAPSRTRVLAVALVVTAACTDLFGPDPLAAPQLRLLAIDDLQTSLADGGVMYVDAYPADTTFRLGSNQRLHVEITTTSGDRESARLGRYLCPHRERGPHFSCFDFMILMRAGYDVRSIAGYVAAAGGRFSLISSTGSLGSAVLFSPDDLVGRTRDARSWPGVAHTELVFPFCAEWAPRCLSLSDLEVPVPVDGGAAVPGDGIVQVYSGDTVVVAYRQPTGQVLQARRAVP